MTTPFSEALKEEFFHEIACHPLVRNLMANNDWLPLSILNDTKMDTEWNSKKWREFLKTNEQAVGHHELLKSLIITREAECVLSHTH